MVKFILFSSFFLYSAISVVFFDNGLVDYFKLRSELKQSKSDLAHTKAIYSKKSDRVQKLYENRMDQDFLDEIARENLGFAKEGEVVIYKD